MVQLNILLKNQKKNRYRIYFCNKTYMCYMEQKIEFKYVFINMKIKTMEHKFQML